jgi:multicomponent Na+:H+ antiporter subunit E
MEKTRKAVIATRSTSDRLLFVATRATVFALLWLVVAGADPTSWIIGVPAVGLTTLAAWRLSQRRGGRPRLLGILRFVPYFLWESVRGGLDVASRVLRPRPRIAPDVLTYDLHLQGANARVMFLNAISLLPGTLSADLRGDVVYVHALDARDDIGPSLRDLEARIGGLFGESAREHQHG